MDTHVRIISILDIVFGIIGAVVGVIMLIAFLAGAASVGTSGAEGATAGAAIIASVGLVGSIIIIGISVFEIIVGINLQAYKSWARIVQIILGILSLPGFPIGTALGIYYIWAMINKETIALFEKKNPMQKAA